MRRFEVMVQLLLRLSDTPGEWGLVELQGQLETRHQAPFNSLHLGDLHFDDQGTPSLIIGHHLLTGKVVQLDKPLAVIAKRLNTTQDTIDMETEHTVEKERGSNTEYEITGLITRKIIFKNRPKPIITSTLPLKKR